MPILLRDRRFLGIAVILIGCTVFSLLAFPVINFAADTTALQFQAMMASLADIRSQTLATREELRSYRSEMLKRTNDATLGIKSLSDRIDNLDYSHQVLEVGKDHDHILEIQATLDKAREQREEQTREAKESADEIVAWERGIAIPLILALIFWVGRALAAKWRAVAETEQTQAHRERMESGLVTLGKKADAAYEAGNEHQRAETSIRQHQARQDKRIDDIEEGGLD